MALTSVDRDTLISSKNLEETRAIVSRAFCDHRLHLQTKGEGIDAHIHIRPLSNITVVRIAYGAPVVIEPGVIDDFYLLRIVLSGRAEIEADNQSFHADPSTATLINPTQHTRILPSGDCTSLLFKFDRTRMEALLCNKMQYHMGAPLTFCPPIDLSTVGGQRMHRFAKYLVDDLDSTHPLGMEPHFSDSFEQVLMTMLLQFVPNNYSSIWERVSPDISPRHIKRAISYIEAQFDSPLTSEEIANAAGVSVRTLSNGFQRFHDETPMGFLRAVRLRKAHELLKQARGSEKITSIALQVGFTHLGRFAALYKLYYGCSPSETVRRSS